jgi:hypothetical protein
VEIDTVVKGILDNFNYDKELKALRKKKESETNKQENNSSFNERS